MVSSPSSILALTTLICSPTLKSRLKERNSYESNLVKAGADLILDSVNDLINFEIDFYTKILK